MGGLLLGDSYIKQSIKKSLPTEIQLQAVKYDRPALRAFIKKHCPTPSLSVKPHPSSLDKGYLIVSCGNSSTGRTFKYSLEGNVPVVTTLRNILRHESLTSENVVLKAIPLSKARYRNILQLDGVIGKQAKRDRKKDTGINIGDIYEPYIIEKGDKIDIRAMSDHFLIIQKGIARENGRVNDIIKVENLESSRIIRAKVISSFDVEVGT